jgi:branched-chain amino acid transport system ATP-binding protein
MSYLKSEALQKSFGGNHAVDGVSIEIAEGELVGLIGPNGSGKTTLLNILSGHLMPDSGRLTLEGRDVTGKPPHWLAKAGLLRMFQLTRVFNRISSLDNLLVAGRGLGLDSASADQRAKGLLHELSLDEVADLDAGQLSGGQRKLLEFGSCFMVPPRVALLDEPFAAIHPAMREIMAKFVRQRHAEGQTFVLVSHDMPVVQELCRRSICMNAGAVLADGLTGEVLDNTDVIEAYLGGEAG